MIAAPSLVFSPPAAAPRAPALRAAARAGSAGGRLPAALSSAALTRRPALGIRRGASLVVRAKSEYYETIDGVKYDKGVLDAVREAVAGEGDGRVSKADAEEVWEKVIDANKVTDTERKTVEYAMANFNWTAAATKWFNEKLAEYDAAN